MVISGKIRSSNWQFYFRRAKNTSLLVYIVSFFLFLSLSPSISLSFSPCAPMGNINTSVSIPSSVTLPIAPSSYSDMSSLQEAQETETEQEESSLTWLPPMEESHIDAVEEIIDYKFCDRSLVEEAMTHKSFYSRSKPVKSYERLEFMGDAVLNFGVASEVFYNYPDLAPGPMTRLRAANVDKEKLARIAIEHGLHRYLRHKAPRLESQVRHESLFICV